MVTGTLVSGRIAVEDRLVLSMLNEAVSCLHDGVVADADLLDAGVIFGTEGVADGALRRGDADAQRQLDDRHQMGVEIGDEVVAALQRRI